MKTMKSRHLALALFPALLLAACSSTSPSVTHNSSFIAPLSAVQAQPLIANSPVMPQGNMTMVLSLTVDDDARVTAASGTFTGTFSGFPAISSLSGAHVNSGAAGVNGPVVIDLESHAWASDIRQRRHGDSEHHGQC